MAEDGSRGHIMLFNHGEGLGIYFEKNWLSGILMAS